MLIIFEGADNSGKSTILQKFHELLKDQNKIDTAICMRKSFKNHNPKTDPYEFNWNLTDSAIWDWRFWLESMEDACKKHDFIWDRSWITQVVYQQVLGPWSTTPNHLATYAGHLKMMTKIPHMIVLCRRDADEATYSDEMLAKDRRGEIDKEFMRIAVIHDQELNFVYIDNNNHSVAKNAHKVLAAYNKLQEQYASN